MQVIGDAGGQTVGVQYDKLAKVGRTQTASDAFLHGGNPVGAHGNQLAEHQIQTERIFRADETAGVPHAAAGGPVSFHRFHRIHDGENRSDGLGEVHQHRAEVILVLVAVVHLRLLQAGDAPEQILHTAGQPGHAVGLELADRHHDIGLAHRVDEVKFLAAPRLDCRDSAIADLKVQLGSGLLAGLLNAADRVDALELGRSVQAAG